MISSNLIKRLGMGALAIIVLFFALYFSHCPSCRPIFSLLVVSVTIAALHEFYQLAETKGVKPLKTVGIMGALLYMASLTLYTYDPSLSLLPWASLSLTLLAGFIYFFYHENHALLSLSVTFFGLMYLALPLGMFILINTFSFHDGSQDGRWWVFYIVAMTKISDMAAYFFGKIVGSHRLAKSISPKKTIEGAVAGLVAAICISMFFSFLAAQVTSSPSIVIPWSDALVLGVLAGILAPLGDLSESLLKRDAGVKHSSALPGLGGFLDLVDSLIFTTPLVYFYLLATFR